MNKNFKRIIFAVVYLAYTSIYIARLNLSMAGSGLISMNVISTVQMGLLGSVFSTVFAVGRFVNGGISDRRPPWVMITAGLVIAGISNIFVGFFPPFTGMFILWTANAYAQSMLWSSVLCVVSQVYGEKEAKKKTSVMITSVATGNILGIVVNTFLITHFGERFAFFIPGAMTIILGAAVMLCTRGIENAKTEKKHISLFKLIRNKELATMSIPAMFHGVMKENISLWMAVYVVDKYSVDLSTSSLYILLIPVIGFLGRAVYTPLYSMMGERENAVSLAGFLVCTAASLMLCFGKIGMAASVMALGVIYAAVSVINTSFLSIYPLRYTKTGNISSVSGIMDFATYLGAGVSSVIYGAVIKHFGYLPMFISWAVISVISMALIVKAERTQRYLK